MAGRASGPARGQGTGSWAGGRGVAEAFVQGEEAEGLPEGAEGDVEGVVAGGGVVEAVQADGEEFQLLQVGFLGLVMGPELLVVQVLLEVAQVAAESRRGEAVRPGQGAVRDAVQETPVDLDPGGVIADSTTLVHLNTVSRWQFSVKESGRG